MILPYFNGLVSPSHDLAGTNVGNRGWQLAPLQDNVLRHLAVCIDIHALVIVTQQKLHAVRVGQGDDSVRSNWALRSMLKKKKKRRKVIIRGMPVHACTCVTIMLPLP